MRTCLVVEDSMLARKEMLRLLKELGTFDIIRTAENATDAKKMFLELQPDIIFLDIHLPGKTGFEFLEELDFIPSIVFTTSYDQYAIKSFEYNAIDYLLKPIRKSRLEKSINKYLNTNLNSKPDKRILISEGEDLVFLHISEIFFFESYGNYSKIHHENGIKIYLKTLQYLERSLDPEVFFRINRKQILNLEKIEKITKSSSGGLELQVMGGFNLKVSRRRAKTIRKKFQL